MGVHPIAVEQIEFYVVKAVAYRMWDEHCDIGGGRWVT